MSSVNVSPQEVEYESRDRYPMLRNMMSGYFYQTAELIEPSSDRIVQSFRDDNDADVAADLSEEVSRFLLRYGLDNEQLCQAFQAIFRPESDFPCFEDRSAKDALLRVIEIMTEPR